MGIVVVEIFFQSLEGKIPHPLKSTTAVYLWSTLLAKLIHTILQEVDTIKYRWNKIPIKYQSNEGLPILVTHVYSTGTNDGNYLQFLVSLSRKSDEKEKKKKKNLEWQLQSFLRYTQMQ